MNLAGRGLTDPSPPFDTFPDWVAFVAIAGVVDSAVVRVLLRLLLFKLFLL